MRVVLDTNVVLSALVFGGGAAGRLRLGWQQGTFVPLASTATVQELVRVLAYPKFRLAPAEQQELLADYLPWVQTVRIPQPGGEESLNVAAAAAVCLYESARQRGLIASSTASTITG